MFSFLAKLQHVRFERIVMWLEWCLLAVALSLYVYFIVMSVVQVVLRQELAASIREAETEVSELEATYFARQNELSEELATEYKLVAQKPHAYVHVSDGDLLTRRQ